MKYHIVINSWGIHLFFEEYLIAVIEDKKKRDTTLWYVTYEK